MIEAFNRKESNDLSKSLVLAGEEVLRLPEGLLWSFSEKIHNKLAKHPNTMLQFPPDKLIDAMIRKMAVVATNEDRDQLLGFAQLWEYAPGVLEFGSWMSFVPGIGRSILLAGSLVGYQIDPKLQVIAIVERSNKSAKTSIEKMGWKWIGEKDSNQLVNPMTLQSARMDIFDVSFSKFVPQAPPRTRLALESENYQLALGI